MRHTRFALILLVFSLVVAGCDSGGSNDNDSDLPNDGSLSATVGGSSFDATVVTATYESGVLGIGGNLGASQAGGQEQINLTVPNASAGTHQFAIGGAVGVYSKAESVTNVQAYAAMSGSITIDSIDENGARGSFEFTGRSNSGTSIEVTDGSFDVTF